MKITVFNGSPRAKKSNTHIMVEEFLAGAREAGAETENIFLAQKKIKHCLGCFSCWIKTPGKCVIKDDMEELLDKYLKSDIIVHACPIYVGSVTGIHKDFIDRTLPLADPHFEYGRNGVAKHVPRYEKYPDQVLISNCGFPEMDHFKFFRNVFNYLEYNGMKNFIGQIFRSQGELLNADDQELKPIIDNYKALLRKAGKEVVENRAICEETQKALEEPLIPVKMYIDIGNKYWDEVLSKIS